VTTGCDDGSARNSDGNCPTPGTGSQPTCGFPKTLIAGQCVCRGGTVGDDCHVPTKETKCQTGTHLVDGECVRGLAKKKKKKSTPKSTDDPPSQSGPNIQFNIDIVPGLGGNRGGGPRHTPPPNRGGSKG